MPQILKLKRTRNVAARRLKRDLVELQQANILSIAAQPMDNNIFEWHVNIKPTDGVYSGVYFHLIMIFPITYPSKPPKVKICTPIKHPNIFDSYLCLSMLREHTSDVPYEGWSGAYSVTSVLMQLQSFLFAEKIDQDGGYQANARVSDKDVNQSISICKTFRCVICKHSHNTPTPKVKGPKESLIKVFPTDPKSGHVTVQGSACQTTHTYWVGAYGEFGVNYGKIFYEAFINWTGDKWASTNIRGGLCRFGFGSEDAMVCGRDCESFGYGGTGMYSYSNQFNKFGQSFTKDDTITVAIDFDNYRIYFAKNGKLMEPLRELYIPDYLQGVLLYPILSFKNSRAEFNFGEPKKPCKWLLNNQFKSLEAVVIEQGTLDGENDDNIDQNNNKNVNWHSQGIIEPLWLAIFESLQVPEIFNTKFVCKKWNLIVSKYNVMERNEIYCYFTKGKLGKNKGGKILGIGLNVAVNSNGQAAIKSQMDILSLNAWRNGCRIGVWGEKLTHFLPLVMNREHADVAGQVIRDHLIILSKAGIVMRSNYSNSLEKEISNNQCLKLIDTLITMMNQIVVQFVMSNSNANQVSVKKVSMIMCEKVVLGYCALHHLLLYLQSSNKKIVNRFANKTINMFLNHSDGSNKSLCRDLGKFLIYLMLSTKYEWKDVAVLFVKEVMTRNVKWMVKDHSKYDNTNVINNRLKTTFTATKISRRLVMFQVWFMKNNSNQTLNGYNYRLGRPKQYVRNGIQKKTKFILNSKKWWDYFNELGIIIKDDKAIDQLLRFAVYNSLKKGYHRSFNSSKIKSVKAPFIRVNSSGYKKKLYQDEGDDNKFNDNQTGIAIGSGRGWGKSVATIGWRGRGRGRGRGRSRGRGANQPLNTFGRGRGTGRGRGRGIRQPVNTIGRGRGRGRPRGSTARVYNSMRQQNNNNNVNNIQQPQLNQPNVNNNQPQYINQHNNNNNQYNNNNNNRNNNINNQQPGSTQNQQADLPQRQSKSQRRKRRKRKNQQKSNKQTK